MKDIHSLNVRLPKDLHRFLKILSAQEGMSLNAMIVLALDKFKHNVERELPFNDAIR
jgi:predicted HicB family RNase H-like nuclease